MKAYRYLLLDTALTLVRIHGLPMQAEDELTQRCADLWWSLNKHERVLMQNSATIMNAVEDRALAAKDQDGQEDSQAAQEAGEAG